MNENSKITGFSHGGAVYSSVRIDDDGIFTMNGGEISGNSNTGAVSVHSSGSTFKMNGGTITNNNCTNGGSGGVNLYMGTFIKNGGTISGNTSSDTDVSQASMKAGAKYGTDSSIETLTEDRKISTAF